MTLTAEQTAAHMVRFLDMLDGAFRGYRRPDGMPERLRHAAAATPRHLFVHRYRLRGGSLGTRAEAATLLDTDADPTAGLADIYSDAVMTHVDAAGERLQSSNS